MITMQEMKKNVITRSLKKLREGVYNLYMHRDVEHYLVHIMRGHEILYQSWIL